MNTKTPRSDATWDKLHDHACSDLIRKQVLLDLCRQIEGELAEMNRKHRNACEHIENMESAIDGEVTQ